MTDEQADRPASDEAQAAPLLKDDEKWPAGTSDTDRTCWICSGATVYRQCKIICQTCGFMRDCSDP